MCLSLLGTWAGPGWDPAHSTIYQVLQSIQTLILNKFPLENEPAYEAVGPEGPRGHLLRNARFNMEVRLCTLRYGVTAFIKAPPRFFEAAVQAHVSHKKRELAAQAVLWAEEAVLFARYQMELSTQQGAAVELQFIGGPLQEVGGQTARTPSPASKVRSMEQLAEQLATLRGRAAALGAPQPLAPSREASGGHGGSGVGGSGGGGGGGGGGADAQEQWSCSVCQKVFLGLNVQARLRQHEKDAHGIAASSHLGGTLPKSAPKSALNSSAPVAPSVSLFWVAVATMEASNELLTALQGVPDPTPP